MKRRDNGSGSIRQRADGTWEGRYTDALGKQKSVYGKTKNEANEKMKKLSYINSITYYDDIGGDVSLSIWFEHYIEIKRRMLKPQSTKQILLAFKKHIEPVIGKKRICNISFNDLSRVIAIVSDKGLSKATQTNVYHHLNAMFNFAFEEGVIHRNPMITVSKKLIGDTHKTTRRSLTDEEIETIMRYVRSRDYQFFIILNIMLYTGMRPGEVCGIKWADIDCDFQYLTVTESISSKEYDRTLKTESSHRRLPLPKFITEELKKRYEGMGQYQDPNMYIFTNKFGNSYTTSYVDTRFKKLCRELDEFTGMNISKITPHYLRHTFATKGVQSGIDIVIMKDLLGHANTNTLLQTYAHADNKLKEESINKISDNIVY